MGGLGRAAPDTMDPMWSVFEMLESESHPSGDAGRPSAIAPAMAESSAVRGPGRATPDAIVPMWPIVQMLESDSHYPGKLWRCRLCQHGPQCSRRLSDCDFAHHLGELWAPDETTVHYTQAWRTQGIDRWFGQSMSTEQLRNIRWYHEQTPHYEVPAWVYGLRYMTVDKQFVTDLYLPWDYGLEADCRLLCRHRRGQLPFSYMEGMWQKLAARKAALAQLGR